METLFIVLIIFICLLLMGVVLIQNSKGGGLASNFSSSNQFMGVRQTTDYLEKATWTLAISLMVVCIASTLTLGGIQEESGVSGLQEYSIDNQTSVPAGYNNPDEDQE